MVLNLTDKEFVNIVNTQLINTHDSYTLYNTLADIYKDNLTVNNFTILLLDANDNNYYIEYSTLDNINRYRYRVYPLFNNKYLRRMYALGEFRQNFSENDSEFLLIENEKLNIRSGIPLFFKSRIIGFIIFHNKYYFSNEELSKVKYLNNKIAEEIVVLKRLEDSYETIKDYKQILNVFKFLNHLFKETEKDKILNIIINKFFLFLEAEAACVCILEKNKWKTSSELGLNENIINEIVYPDGLKVIDFVKQLKQTMFIGNTDIHDQLDLSGLTVNIKSIICIPLIDNNECNTILTLVNINKHLTDNIMLYIKQMADISSLALQNYKLNSSKKVPLKKQVETLNNFKATVIMTLENILSEFEI